MKNDFKTREQLISELETLRSALNDIQVVEADRRNIERRFHELIQESLDGYTMLDKEGRFMLCNPVYCKMTGYTIEELKIKNYKELTPEKYHALDKRQLEQMLIRGVSDLYEKEYTRSDGTKFPIEIRSYIVRDGEGEFNGTWSFVRDITDRKQADRERQKLQEQLLQAQKMESVGRLAGGVAHDFNNMLSVIIGHSQLALTKLRHDEALHSDLQQVINAASRSADITRQLLAFARKQTIAPIVLDLNETVDGMLKMLRRIIGEDIDLAWLPASNLWPVMMDPAQIDQMLANLCVNARDAIEGVGKITIETKNVNLDETYREKHAGFLPGQFVMLVVSDNGCSIEKENLANIFEPFFTTKELGKGTGLGLSTLYGIVKQNQGFVNVYSEPGKGTTFRIYLPRQIGETETPLGVAQAQIAEGRGETILLVEDDLSVLKVTKQMLENLRYTVVAAASPAEALELANNYTDEIQLLISDVIMPEISGKEVAEEITKICPNVKILFMSGYTPNAIVHHGILEKGKHFIQKPLRLDTLARKVREVLEFEGK